MWQLVTGVENEDKKGAMIKEHRRGADHTASVNLALNTCEELGAGGASRADPPNHRPGTSRELVPGRLH